MTETLLVLNAGSTSLKFQLFAQDEALSLLARGQVAAIGCAPVFTVNEEKPVTLCLGSTHEDALALILGWIEAQPEGWTITAAGHRVVHGGEIYSAPVKITPQVLKTLHTLTSLAPLHQPHNLAAIEILAKLRPALPQVACFDTAFHASNEPLFTSFALPEELRSQGIRRYGFHGLSYEWIAESLRRDHPTLAQGRVVVAHLGGGASLCALKNGKSLTTTMGMTALDGLPMGTRCGSLDPGVVIHMMRSLGMTPDAIEKTLYHHSGLKGLSGLSGDVKDLLNSTDQRACFALDYFTMKTAQFIGMMTVALGGLDALVFTGGIGEHAAPVREAIVARLSCLGTFQTLIIPTNEERMIARHVRSIGQN